MENESQMISAELMPWILGGVTLFLGVLGWIWNRQISKIDKVSEDLEDHKLYVSKNHVTHDDITELKDGLYSRLDRHENKLDGFLRSISDSVTQSAFDLAKDQLHARCNDLEKRKMDKVAIG
jgi:hypothetical protein